MTKPEWPDRAEEPSEGLVLLRRAAIGLVGGLALVFLAGMIAGFVTGVLQQGGPNLRDAAILAAMLLAGACVGYGMWRLWPRSIEAPLSPRVRSARNILFVSAALGLPLGFLMGIADGGAERVFSSAPVSPGAAIAAIVIYAVFFWLSWLWWQRIDEHEAGAYRDGAMVAVHSYLFIVPVWWLATRAGWLPPQEPMPVLVAVSAVWMIVWFVRRYF